MSDNRRARFFRAPSRAAALIGARVAGGLFALGVAGVAIAGAALVPIPTYSADPATIVVEPVAAPQQVVCPGGLLQLGDLSGQDAARATALGRPQATFASSEGQPSTEVVDGASDSRASSPLVVTAEAGDSATAPLVSASQVETAATPEIRGLAAASCRPVDDESWLVAGATTTGRTTLISIVNASDVVSTVSIDVFAESGAIETAAVSELSVQPRSQRVIPLAGIAPDVASPVVRVSSVGGQIVASLQQSIVRGLEPGGVEVIGASVPLASTHVIPGIVISNGELIESALGAPGYADIAPVLRVLATGRDRVQVTAQLVPEDPALPAETLEFSVDGGVVTDLPIEELVDGAYSLYLSSDVDFIAAVRFASITAQRGSDGFVVNDFAWAPSAPALADDVLFSTANGPEPVLHVANPTDETLTVTLSGGVTLSIPAQTSVARPLEAGTTYSMTGARGAHASVSYSSAGQIASHPVEPQAATASDILIYP